MVIIIIKTGCTLCSDLTPANFAKVTKRIENVESMHPTVTVKCTFSAKWKRLTHILPHSWQAVWGCAHSPLGVTAAGPAAAWQYSQNQHCHSWSEASRACCAWCEARAGGELASRPCGQLDRSAAGQTTVLYRHCRRHARSVEPEMKTSTQNESSV